METNTILLIIIIALALLLVGLIVFFFKGSSEIPQSTAAPKELKPAAAAQDTRSKPTHIDGMDKVHDAPAAAKKTVGASDPTPPSGIRVDTRTPAAGTAPLRKDDITPPGGTATLQAPAKSGTMALHTGFLDQELPKILQEAAPAQKPVVKEEPKQDIADWLVAASTKPSAKTEAVITPAKTPALQAQSAQTAPLDVSSADNSSTDALEERFYNPSLSSEERASALKELLQKTSKDEQQLYVVEAINSHNELVQITALESMTASEDDAIVDELIPLIEAQSPKLSLAAAQALHKIGGPIVQQALLIGVESPNMEVRNYAVKALVEQADRTLELQLHDMLQEDDVKRVSAASQILGKLGGPENTELLETRASMADDNEALQQTLKKDAALARQKDSSSARDSGSNDRQLEEFELSLDPDLFK